MQSSDRKTNKVMCMCQLSPVPSQSEFSYKNCFALQLLVMECLECYKRTEFHHFNNTEHTHVISTNLLKNNVF